MLLVALAALIGALAEFDGAADVPLVLELASAQADINKAAVNNATPTPIGAHHIRVCPAFRAGFERDPAESTMRCPVAAASSVARVCFMTSPPEAATRLARVGCGMVRHAGGGFKHHADAARL
ncbi:hypothetical protein [Paraburkholderia bryophila]|uniref:hypothetical protein n=1 Tax=Paraburkholderia bryophila TaxID=420952 RepID=UPI001FC7D68D|nr:hypothetical protein [Paraburkholderia bryophila]